MKIFKYKKPNRKSNLIKIGNKTLFSVLFEIRFVYAFSLLISSPVRLATQEEEETTSSCFCNETLCSQTSHGNTIAPLPSTYNPYSSAHISYFNSAIETAIKQHLHDDEPIPFIDDNLSMTHSRKSSACWSDRTSLSSRFNLAWKLNLMRTSNQHRSQTPVNETAANPKRFNYRTIRYTIPPSSHEHHRIHEQL